MAKAKAKGKTAKKSGKTSAKAAMPKGAKLQAKRKVANGLVATTKADVPKRVAPSAAVSGVPTAAAGGMGSKVIYILSDSTGNLARHMLTAFLTQFPPGSFAVHPLTFLQDSGSLNKALDRVAAAPGLVFHALVSGEAKGTVERRCKERQIPVCDLTGDFVNFIALNSGVAPREDPSRLHDTDETYHGRIKAIEFALAHDDGLGLETLHEAHLVLTGISRTSKTPTTIYLAQHGYKVGNVALSMDVPPPNELLNLPHNKVVGLLIDAPQLIEIRTRRQREWGMGDTRYNDDEYVYNEIDWSKRLFRQRGWVTVNVTDQAIEETAARVLEIVGFTKPPG